MTLISAEEKQIQKLSDECDTVQQCILALEENETTCNERIAELDNMAREKTYVIALVARH